MDKFFDVMEGPVGRVLRVALGAILVYVGLGQMTGTYVATTGRQAESTRFTTSAVGESTYKTAMSIPFGGVGGGPALQLNPNPP